MYGSQTSDTILIFRSDYLAILSNHSFDHVYGVYCGNKTGHIVHTAGDYVIIVFRSAVQEGGFLLFFNVALPGKCNQKLHVTNYAVKCVRSIAVIQ